MRGITTLVSLLALSGQNCLAALIVVEPETSTNYGVSVLIQETQKFPTGPITLVNQSDSDSGLPAGLVMVEGIGRGSNGSGSARSGAEAFDYSNSILLNGWAAAKNEPHAGTGSVSARADMAINARIRIDPSPGENIGDEVMLFAHLHGADGSDANWFANFSTLGIGPSVRHDFASPTTLETFPFTMNIGQRIRMAFGIDAIPGAAGGMKRADIAFEISFNGTPPPAPPIVSAPSIPEPSSFVLMTIAVLGIALIRAHRSFWKVSTEHERAC